MTVETATDRQGMMNGSDFRTAVDIGTGTDIFGIIDNVAVEALGISGQRTGLRCLNADVVSVAIGSTLTISGTTWTVRDKQQGDHTVLLILEATT